MTKITFGKLYAFFPNSNELEKRVFSKLDFHIRFIHCGFPEAVNIFDYLLEHKITEHKINALKQEYNLPSLKIDENKLGDKVLFVILSLFMQYEVIVAGTAGLDYNSVKKISEISKFLVTSLNKKTIILVYPPRTNSTSRNQEDFRLVELEDDDLIHWESWLDKMEKSE